MSMQAAFEALTNEAAEWDTTSQTLATAEVGAQDLYLDESNFSFITFLTGVGTTYETARQHVLDVLAAGRGETHELGEALRAVRADFESTDQSRRDAIAQLWQAEE